MPNLPDTSDAYKRFALQKNGLDPDQYDLSDDGILTPKVIEQPGINAGLSPVDDSQPPVAAKPAPTTSVGGTLLHSALNSAIPTGVGLGAAAGGVAATPWIAGSLGLAPETGGASLLGLLVPLLAGAAGGYAGSKLQQPLLSDSFKQQTAQEKQEHPIAATIGNLAPSALALNPISGLRNLVTAGEDAPGIIPSIGKLLAGRVGITQLPDESIDALRNAGVNAGIQGGTDVAQQLMSGQPFSVPQALINTASGGIMNEPWGVGKMLFPHPSQANAPVEAKPQAPESVGTPTVTPEDLAIQSANQKLNAQDANENLDFTQPGLGDDKKSLEDSVSGLEQQKAKLQKTADDVNDLVGRRTDALQQIDDLKKQIDLAKGTLNVQKAPEPLIDTSQANTPTESERQGDNLKGVQGSTGGAYSSIIPAETSVEKAMNRQTRYQEGPSEELKGILNGGIPNDEESNKVFLQHLLDKGYSKSVANQIVNDSNTRMDFLSKLRAKEVDRIKQRLATFNGSSQEYQGLKARLKELGMQRGQERSGNAEVGEFYTGPKYQEEPAPVKKPIETVATDNDPYLLRNSSNAYKQQVYRLAARRGITLREAMGLVKPDTGKEVLGAYTPNTREAAVNPNRAELDTPIHEVTHGFVDDLLNSERPADRALGKRALDIFGGNESQAEEALVGKLGVAGVPRVEEQLHGSALRNFNSWFGDYKSRMKLNLGMGSDEDVIRHLSARTFHDAPYGTRNELLKYTGFQPGFAGREGGRLYTANEDIKDADGKLLLKKGSTMSEHTLQKLGVKYQDGSKDLYHYAGVIRDSAVIGERIPDRVWNISHEELGYPDNLRWKYWSPDKEVIWSGNPSEDNKLAVDSFLQKRGLEVKKHVESFNMDKLMMEEFANDRKHKYQKESLLRPTPISYNDLSPEDKKTYGKLHTDALNARIEHEKAPSEASSNNIIDKELALKKFEEEKFPGREAVTKYQETGNLIDREQPTELQKAFNKVHEQQRWEGPEDMFDEKHNPNVRRGTGLWTDSLEHGGDLVHRSSYSGYNDFGGGGIDYGREATLNKAERLLNRYKAKEGWMPISQDVDEQIGRNYAYDKKNGDFRGTEEEYRKGLKEAGERYAQSYDKIEPVTRVQQLGKEIAAHTGRFEFNKAIPKLQELIKTLKAKNWKDSYSKPLPNFEGITGNLKYQSEASPALRMGLPKVPERFKGNDHKEEHIQLPITRSANDTVLKKDGPRAKPFISAITDNANQRSETISRYRKQYEDAVGDLNKEQRDKLENLLTRESRDNAFHVDELTDPKEIEAYHGLRNFIRQMQEDRIEANQPVKSYDASGKPIVREAGIDPYYWPNQMNPQVIAELHKGDTPQAQHLREVWNKHQIANGSSDKQSNEALDAILGSYSKVAPNLAHFRGVDVEQGSGLPQEFMRPGLDRNMDRYINRFSSARAYHDTIESRPEVASLIGEKNTPWGEPLPEKYQNVKPLASQEARDIVKRLKGQDYNPEEGKLHALERVAAAAILGPKTNVHILGSTVANSIGMAKPSEAPGMIMHMVTDFSKAAKHAQEMGNIQARHKIFSGLFDAHATQVERLNIIADGIGRLNGRGIIDYIAKTLAQAGGEYLVRARIPLAQTGDKQAIRFMKEVDKNWSPDKNYSEGDITRLGSNFSNFLHGVHDSRTQPAWMLKDNIIQPFTSLMSWNIAQTNTFMKHVITPAVKDGNFAPLITTTLGAVLGGYVIKQAREAISNKKSPIPSFQEIANSSKGLEGNIPLDIYNLLGMTSYAGYGGILSLGARSIFDLKYKNPPQGAVFPLDEVLTGGTMTLAHAASALMASHDINETMRIATKAGADLFNNNVQMANIALSWADQEGLTGDERNRTKKLNTEEADLRRYKEVEGLPYSEQGTDSANPYLNMNRKEYLHATDVGKAAERLPDLIQQAVDDSGGNIEVLRNKLSALKDSTYPSMPSMENAPRQFWNYYTYLQKTKGPEVASARLQEYIQNNMINRVKSDLVPSF